MTAILQNKKIQTLLIVLLRTFAIGPMAIVFLGTYKENSMMHFILPFYLFLLVDQLAQYIAGNNYRKKEPQQTLVKVVLYVILFLLAISFTLFHHQEWMIWVSTLLLIYALVSWFNYWQKSPFIETLFYPVFKALFEGIILNICLFFLGIHFISTNFIYHLIPITILYFAVAILEQNIFANIIHPINQIIYFISFILYHILLVYMYIKHILNLPILIIILAVNAIFVALYTNKKLSSQQKICLIAALLFLNSLLLAINLHYFLAKI